MLFNSTEFLGFFGMFFAAYLLSQRHLFLRNVVIVVGSYVFYSAWDPRFTALLLLTTVVDYSVARFLDGTKSPRSRRALLVASLTVNLGVLGLFKYFGFFRESLELLLNTLGAGVHWRIWELVLPVGISFYTFQSMSYVVDVYRRQMAATRNFIQFMAYVSFFPQLVAGPIERGKHLLPQFNRTLQITIGNIESGIWLVLWGLFKKVVLADNLAPLVELVYDHGSPSGPMVALGTIAFALQIYCDFSGYTDIARGLARLLGFELMLNFNLPYFARSLRDFWSRWHISLSTWLRDYLYIPLGGNRRGEGRTYLNLAVTFLLGGLWHGAAATFILWGAWHGVGLIVNHWWRLHRPWNRPLPAWLGWGVTGVFVLYGWMLFRAHSFYQIERFTASLVNFSLPTWWPTYVTNLIALAAPLVLMQLWQWRSGRLEAPLTLSRWTRGVLQGIMLLATAAFWRPDAVPFIYFQF